MRRTQESRVRAAALGRHDDTRVEKEIGHVDRGLEHPTRVVPEIEHEAFEQAAALVLHGVDGAAEFACCRFAELAQANIA